MDYALYFEKQDCVLEIRPLEQFFEKEVPLPIVTEEIVQFNRCYYICTNEKLLIEKATGLKESWRQETKQRLQKIMNISF